MIQAMLIVVSMLLGIVMGCITGITPGLHINLVALIVVAFFTQGISLNLAAFIVAMSITHTFVDFLPSIFLGMPDEDTALSVLPGHRMMQKGFGYAAFKLSLIGSLLGLVIAVLLLPVYSFAVPKLYGFVKQYMFYILLACLFVVLAKEKNKLECLAVFLMAGFLGIITLNLKHIRQPLLPLLTGLFGCSMLVFSLLTKAKPKKQVLKSISISKKEKIKAMIAGIVAASLVSFLPGLGSSHAAVIGSSFFKLSDAGFIMLLGSINTIVMLLSFLALMLIGKPRTGSAAMLERIININPSTIIMLYIIALITGFIAFIIAAKLGRTIAKNIHKINYTKINVAVLLFVVLLCIVVSGIYSLIVLVAATSLGVFTTTRGIRKMYLMGCLLLPVMIYYWPF